MKKMRGLQLVVALLVVANVCCVATIAASPPAAAAPGHWLMGYYPGYQRDLMPPDEIDWTAMTHIAVGVVVPRKNGTLNMSFDIDPSQGPVFAKDLASRAHAKNVVPILMVGGAGARKGFVGAASASHRKQFVRNLVATMKQLGFDGLDIDWEPVNRSDQRPLAALVSALRAAAPSAVLTMPAFSTSLTFPDVLPVYAQIAPKLDQVNIMTYGMSGAYPGWESWHSSALDGATQATPSSVAVSVASYLGAGVPASKLGVGIGFYGACWSPPVNGPSQPLNGSKILADDNVMSYTHITSSYFTPSAYHYDATAQAPYLSFSAPTGAEGCTWVSYENGDSIAAKGRWAQDHGLSGAIVWTINQGHNSSAPPGQQDALLKAARTAFGA